MGYIYGTLNEQGQCPLIEVEYPEEQTMILEYYHKKRILHSKLYVFSNYKFNYRFAYFESPKKPSKKLDNGIKFIKEYIKAFLTEKDDEISLEQLENYLQ